MDDIRPRQRPIASNQPPTVIAPQSPVASAPEIPQKPKRRKLWLWIAISLLVISIIGSVSAYAGYRYLLSPVNPQNTGRTQVTVESGTSPTNIAQQLKEANVIRNEDAFLLYTRLSGTQNLLQAGSYRLSQSETVPQIVDHLTSGKVDTFDITFLPGATLAQNRQVLIGAGFDGEAVDAALNQSYNSVLFQNKPANTDLEGYIYGETYRISSGATPSDILKQTFAEYEQVIAENNLEASFAARGLSLYQGITLASIIQREAIGGDEPQIAQVFYSRLAMGMELGSDVTYQYIADKTGVARDPTLDSLYNTRRYPGLPPGPIAAPGLAALKAVANPAAGDYVYFLSGDDNVTYFARTFAEHESNISNHCQQKCQIL